MAEKWNYALKKYEPYRLPTGASLYEHDPKTLIQCAECGEEIEYGKCYTSMAILSAVGFGYGVCGKCHKKELEHRLKLER